MTITTLSAAWTVLLAAVGLLLTALINQNYWSPTVKKWVTVGVSAVLGAVYAVASGQIPGVPLEWQSVVTQWIIVAAVLFTIGQAVYQFFKDPLSKFEDITTIQPPKSGDGGLSDAGDEPPADEEAEAVAEDTSGVPPEDGVAG